MTDLETYHYPVQYKQLLNNTQEHEMKILHNDGLYRHLRFQRGDSMIWHWDLITWPGSLAIRGDIGGGHIFTRLPDMLDFFDHGQAPGWINADYWAEKTPDYGRSLQRFSNEKFTAWLMRELAGYSTDWTNKKLVIEDVRDVDSVESAINVLNMHDIAYDYDDPSVWSDYDYHFILGLHAILWGAKKYHAHVRAQV